MAQRRFLGQHLEPPYPAQQLVPFAAPVYGYVAGRAPVRQVITALGGGTLPEKRVQHLTRPRGCPAECLARIGHRATAKGSYVKGTQVGVAEDDLDLGGINLELFCDE